MICDICGKDKDDTEIRENPFMAEVNNDHEEEALCDACYDQLVQDI